MLQGRLPYFLMFKVSRHMAPVDSHPRQTSFYRSLLSTVDFFYHGAHIPSCRGPIRLGLELVGRLLGLFPPAFFGHIVDCDVAAMGFDSSRREYPAANP